ncbi:concanavalin A-like lectin/glucanase domain-containing protein [Hyaloraphidium curvatum]|nr:concanavalin A-like lectin/glucanase domain-containing protein [Hyaloraphidium curvatum]
MTSPPGIRTCLAVLACLAVPLLVPWGPLVPAPASAPDVPPPVPQPAVPPEAVDGWLLELPVDPDGDGRADRVPLSGVLLAGHPPWFVPGPAGFVLRSPVHGARSRTSKFVRCELRESGAPERNGSRRRAPDWPCMSTARGIVAELAVLAAPPKRPRVIIAQLHEKMHDLAYAAYVGQQTGGPGELVLRANDARNRTTLDAAYSLGDTLRLEIAVENGTLTVGYLNRRTGASAAARFRIDPGLVSGGCFFKTGAYPQAYSATQAYPARWNVSGPFDEPDAYGEVLVRSVRLFGS